MKNIILIITLLFSLNLHAETSTGAVNNTMTSVNNGGGCNQTKSLSDLGVLSALLAILSLPGLKKRAAQHKAKK